MAQLPEAITTTVLDLQRRLLAIIHEATTTQFLIVERHGETEITLTDLEQLDNVQQRADTYYSRFNVLLRLYCRVSTFCDICYTRVIDSFN